MTLQKYILLALALCATLSASAQTNGYYRLKNKATGEYATLSSDVLDYDKILYDIGVKKVYNDKKETTGARKTMIAKMGCYLEHDITLTTTPSTIPASVFFLKTQSSSNKTYNLLTEGTSFYTITTGQYTGSANLGTVKIGGFYTTIKPVSGSSGLYTIHIPVNVSYTFLITFSANLGSYYFVANSNHVFGVEKDASANDNAQWYLEKAETFNVAPLSKVKDSQGRYWTTLCVDFPFTIPASGSTVLAAYTVTGKDSEGYAVLNKLEGTIAGGTPCLIECTSDNSETNILNIESGEPTGKACANGAVITTSGNYLQGRYFNAPSANYQYLNTYKSPNVTESLGTEANVLTNDQSNYRVLNCVDGKVGFYKLKGASTTMAANKAFLNIKDLPTVSAAAAKTFTLEDDGDVTGIRQATSADAPTVIYDLQGRRVTAPTHPGIYIVNGRKVVVK